MKTRMMILIVVLFSVVASIRAVTYPKQHYVSGNETVHVSQSAIAPAPALAPAPAPFRNIGGSETLPIGKSKPRRGGIGDLGDEDDCEHLNRTYDSETGNWVCDDCGENLGTMGGTPGSPVHPEDITPVGSAVLPLLLMLLCYALLLYRRKQEVCE